MDCYSQALNECTRMVFNAENAENNNHVHADGTQNTATNTFSERNTKFLKDLRGEIMLRMAVLRKEMGALDQSLQMCTQIVAEHFGDGIRANTLCLKVSFCCYKCIGFIFQLLMFFKCDSMSFIHIGVDS